MVKAAGAPPPPPAADPPDEAEQEPIEPYYFLQENFVVARGILKDEGIVFDQSHPSG
jgi:hypothetical protein